MVVQPRAEDGVDTVYALGGILSAFFNGWDDIEHWEVVLDGEAVFKVVSLWFQK